MELKNLALKHMEFFSRPNEPQRGNNILQPRLFRKSIATYIFNAYINQYMKKLIQFL